MLLPVATRLAMVGLEDEQKLWADAAGADGEAFIVTATAVLLVLSQPPTV